LIGTVAHAAAMPGAVRAELTSALKSSPYRSEALRASYSTSLVKKGAGFQATVYLRSDILGPIKFGPHPERARGEIAMATIKLNKNRKAVGNVRVMRIGAPNGAMK